jgi:hypothetical protein
VDRQLTSRCPFNHPRGRFHPSHKKEATGAREKPRKRQKSENGPEDKASDGFAGGSLAVNRQEEASQGRDLGQSSTRMGVRLTTYTGTDQMIGKPFMYSDNE